MARKNLLVGLNDVEHEQTSSSVAQYTVRGASKSMIRSVSELAKQADAYLEGEHVVELDPGEVDGSFISDRMGDNQEQYQELREAIRERGQDTPILARPHPEVEGRYMVVFGHRRVQVAKELGRTVKAVVKAIDDKMHVIAQGQENSARANLTFIEKAVFASRLEDMGYDRDVICSALASNAAAVSKMISVIKRIPAPVISRIGAAPAIGRERWVELSLMTGRKPEAVDAVIAAPGFDDLESDERFERLFSALNVERKPVRKTTAKPVSKTWSSEDSSVSVAFKRSRNAATIALGAVDGPRFAEWISSNLSDLYEAFRMSEKKEPGD